MLTTLIDKFEMLPSPEEVEIHRVNVITVVLMVRGQARAQCSRGVAHCELKSLSRYLTLIISILS
jgi:hypothetical protein